MQQQTRTPRVSGLRTEEVMRCMHWLTEAEALLDAGRVEDGAAMVSSVKAELVIVDEELTAPLSMAFMLLERVENRLDAARFARDYPVLAPYDTSMCPRCGAAYDRAQFMALGLSVSGEGVWKFDFATLAVRQCGTPDCHDTLSRRIA